MNTFYFILQEPNYPPVIFKTTFYINSGFPKLKIIGNISSNLRRHGSKILSILKYYKLLKLKQILIEIQDLNIKYTNPVYIDLFTTALIPLLSANNKTIQGKLKNNITLIHQDNISYYNFLYFTTLPNTAEIKNTSSTPELTNIKNLYFINTANLNFLNLRNLPYTYKQMSNPITKMPIIQLNKLKLGSWMIINIAKKLDPNITIDTLKKKIHKYQNIINFMHYTTQDFNAHQMWLTYKTQEKLRSPKKRAKILSNIDITTLLNEPIPRTYPLVGQIKYSQINNLRLIDWGSIQNKILLLNISPCKCGNFLSKHVRCVCPRFSLISYFTKYIEPIITTNIYKTIFINNNWMQTYNYQELQKIYSNN